MNGDGQSMGIQVAADPGGDTRRGEGRINVTPWYRLVGVAKSLQLVAKEGEPGLPARVSGRYVVRRRQSSPILPNSQPLNGGSKRCARVTGKAGENGQHSG